MSGLWTVAKNWEDATKFVLDVITKSIDMSKSQKDNLLQEERRLFEKYYQSYPTITGYDTEREIYEYTSNLYAVVRNGDYPEQVKKVFANLADTTYSVSNDGSDLIDNEITIPNWVWIGLFFGAVYLLRK